MQLIRIFSTEKYKGTKDYINSQKKYEIIRTRLHPDGAEGKPADNSGGSGLSACQQERGERYHVSEV